MHSFNAHDARTGYKAVTNLVLLHMKNMDTRLNAEYALGLKPSCIFWFRLVSIFFICRSTRLVTTLYNPACLLSSYSTSEVNIFRYGYIFFSVEIKRHYRVLISKSHTAIGRETIVQNMFPTNHFTHKMTRSS